MHKQSIKAPEVPSTDIYITTIIDRVACARHNVELSEPCYRVPVDAPVKSIRSETWGVCNWRARQAGYIGEPSEKTKALQNR